jgi:hypothetical protein
MVSEYLVHPQYRQKKKVGMPIALNFDKLISTKVRTMTPIREKIILAMFFCLVALLIPIAETRVLKFPNKSIGGLHLASDAMESGRDIMRTAKRVGFAVGTVTLKVKPNETVLVDLNQEAFMHPELLRQVSPHGIDRLKFAFYSMDDQSILHCDDALSTVPEDVKHMFAPLGGE